MNIFHHKVNQQEFVSRYFSDKDKCIRLKKGDILLNQHEYNRRIFYIKQGEVIGYLPDTRYPEPIFKGAPGSFVGVYSYFSEDHLSYSEVVAQTPSVVHYFDEDPNALERPEADEFMGFLLNMVVTELSARQHFAARMAQERQKAMNKLIQSEKLATLGQLSAGLAHELNNSIGSLSANLRRLQEDIDVLLIRQKSDQVREFYRRGLEDGLQLSSREARKARDEWSANMELSHSTIRKLTKAGIRAGEVRSAREAEEAANLWNLGYVMHDMRIAAGQAAHVINSIKTMGISNQKWSAGVNVNTTVLEAVAILKSMSGEISLDLQLQENITAIEACHGELVQVWVNLIKNAIESLVQNLEKNRKIKITTREVDKQISVSVEDNGPGIAPDIIDKIYEPSFTTKVGGISLGLGLGLTIVKRIVSEHDGEMRVTSRPGRTRFTVSLPLKQ